VRARIASLITATAIALPLCAASAASAAPAQPAVRHDLTVRVVDRSGHPSGAQVQVVNTATDTSVFMGTGQHRELGAGTYNVAAWILTGPQANPTYTLADQVVDLNRNRTVVLDARQGRLVRLSLNNSSALAETLEIAPIVNGQWAFNPTTVFPPVGLTYVVPMRSRLMALYVYSIWEKKGNTIAHPSPFRYDIVTVFRGGIPSSPVIRTRTSQLARVNVTVRATTGNQQVTMELSPQGRSVILPMNAGTTLGATPAHVVSYRSPGFEWQPIVEWSSPSGTFRDNDLNQQFYGPGTHSELWGAAVFGPGLFDTFAGIQGRALQVGTSSFPMGDVLHPSDEGTVIERLSLYSGRRLLAHGGDPLNVRIPLGSHSYSFRMSATRSAAALLSTQVNAVWQFIGTGVSPLQSSTPVIFSVLLNAGGLDLRNRAAGGSLTRVSMSVYNVEGMLGPVRTVRAWASANNGKNWHLVAVRRTGNHYVISVRNAKAAGFTSLRVYVSDGHGNSEELTVIHAYGVR
jgi:hypothetical protein